MSRNTQVARDGQRPASSPELDREVLRRRKLRSGPPSEADRPPVSTQRPASSPELDREVLRRRKLRSGPPSEADRPPVSTLPGSKPHVHEGQLSL